VENVARFYRQAFGLPERERFINADGTLRSIWLAAGATLLMVELTSDAPRHVEGVGSGPFLLAFQTPPGERAELEARLQSLGAKVDSRTDFSSYTRDPEGNRVAISHHPKPPV
jgi:catechol-2,3-dioxygenase